MKQVLTDKATKKYCLNRKEKKRMCLLDATVRLTNQSKAPTVIANFFEIGSATLLYFHKLEYEAHYGNLQQGHTLSYLLTFLHAHYPGIFLQIIYVCNDLNKGKGKVTLFTSVVLSASRLVLMGADSAPFTPSASVSAPFTGIQSYGYTDRRKVEADVEVTED